MKIRMHDAVTGNVENDDINLFVGDIIVFDEDVINANDLGDYAWETSYDHFSHITKRDKNKKPTMLMVSRYNVMNYLIQLYKNMMDNAYTFGMCNNIEDFDIVLDSAKSLIPVIDRLKNYKDSAKWVVFIP